MGSKITKIKRNKDGEITEVMLQNGIIVPINQAILMAKKGELEETTVVRGKDGGEFLKTDPDKAIDHTIADLPTFK